MCLYIYVRLYNKTNIAVWEGNSTKTIAPLAANTALRGMNIIAVGDDMGNLSPTRGRTFPVHLGYSPSYGSILTSCSGLSELKNLMEKLIYFILKSSVTSLGHCTPVS